MVDLHVPRVESSGSSEIRRSFLARGPDAVREAVVNLIAELVDRGILDTDAIRSIVPGMHQVEFVSSSCPRETALDASIQALRFEPAREDARILNRLRDARIKTLRDLVTRPKVQVRKIHGLGLTSIQQIENALTDRGLKLGLSADQVQFLDSHIDEQDLSVHASNVAAGLGCETMADVLALDRVRLKAKTTLYRRVWKQLDQLFRKHGLSMPPGPPGRK
jgi:hypothetical protein